MGIFDWLTGNSTAKRNNVKVARMKKELQLMTRKQRVERLRKMKNSGYYSSQSARSIGNIYDHDMDLTTDFILYYLLFMNDDIREEAEMVEPMVEQEEPTIGIEEPVSVSSEEVMVASEVINTDSMSSEDVVSEPSKTINTTSETSESYSDDTRSSYGGGSSNDDGGSSSYDSCDSGGGDCGGCD